MAFSNSGETNGSATGRAANAFREAVCIDTRRIYDACSDKDCIRDLQVLFPAPAQAIIDEAATLKTRCAEVIGVYFEVEALPFNKGFFAVDMTFFFKIVLSASGCPATQSVAVEGLGIFCKKVILFGSDAAVKTFSTEEALTQASNCAPIVSVQVIDPLILASRVCEEPCPKAVMVPMLPPEIACKFEGGFENICANRTVTVTLGLFSIVQLMRQVQVMIPIYDFCIPQKECTTQNVEDDPCELFSRIEFPTGEFFPARLDDLDCN